MNLAAILAALEAGASSIGTEAATAAKGALTVLINNLPAIEAAGQAILAGGQAALGPAEEAINSILKLSATPTDADFQKSEADIANNSAAIQEGGDT